MNRNEWSKLYNLLQWDDDMDLVLGNADDEWFDAYTFEDFIKIMKQEALDARRDYIGAISTAKQFPGNAYYKKAVKEAAEEYERFKRVVRALESVKDKFPDHSKQDEKERKVWDKLANYGITNKYQINDVAQELRKLIGSQWEDESDSMDAYDAADNNMQNIVPIPVGDIFGKGDEAGPAEHIPYFEAVANLDHRCYEYFDSRDWNEDEREGEIWDEVINAIDTPEMWTILDNAYENREFFNSLQESLVEDIVKDEDDMLYDDEEETEVNPESTDVELYRLLNKNKGLGDTDDSLFNDDEAVKDIYKKLASVRDPETRDLLDKAYQNALARKKSQRDRANKSIRATTDALTTSEGKLDLIAKKIVEIFESRNPKLKYGESLFIQRDDATGTHRKLQDPYDDENKYQYLYCFFAVDETNKLKCLKVGQANGYGRINQHYDPASKGATSSTLSKSLLEDDLMKPILEAGGVNVDVYRDCASKQLNDSETTRLATANGETSIGDWVKQHCIRYVIAVERGLVGTKSIVANSCEGDLQRAFNPAYEGETSHKGKQNRKDNVSVETDVKNVSNENPYAAAHMEILSAVKAVLPESVVVSDKPRVAPTDPYVQYITLARGVRLELSLATGNNKLRVSIRFKPEENPMFTTETLPGYIRRVEDNLSGNYVETKSVDKIKKGEGFAEAAIGYSFDIQNVYAPSADEINKFVVGAQDCYHAFLACDIVNNSEIEKYARVVKVHEQIRNYITEKTGIQFKNKVPTTRDWEDQKVNSYLDVDITTRRGAGNRVDLSIGLDGNKLNDKETLLKVLDALKARLPDGEESTAVPDIRSGKINDRFGKKVSLDFHIPVGSIYSLTEEELDKIANLYARLYNTAANLFKK